MKGFGKMISFLILLVNLVAAVLMVVTAYSPYITPEEYPLLSCAGLIFPFFLLIDIAFLLFWLVFHHRYAGLSLLAIIICLPPIRTYFPINLRSNDLPSARIKILSYNVMSFDNDKLTDGENPIVKYLAKSNADILCLQEYAVSQDSQHVNQRYVDMMLKSYPYKDITSVGDCSIGNKLALYSRFPIILSHKISYKSAFNGSIYYELNIAGDTVVLINNHLESNKLTLKDRNNYAEILSSIKTGSVKKENARPLLYKLADASVIRAAQARTIAKVIEESPYKSMIVCGDFNDTPLSYTHRVIANRLNDTFTRSGRGLGISYNQRKFFFRIDNILVSPDFKSYNCQVDRFIKTSDHYPIWCYIAKR